MSLRLIAVLAVVFTLLYAREILIPLVLALFLSCLLNPIVDWMELRKIPRGPGAAVVMLAIVAGIGVTGYSLGRQGEALLEQLTFRTVVPGAPSPCRNPSKTSTFI